MAAPRSDPALVAALNASLLSLAGPRSGIRTAAYGKAVAAAVAAHPAVIAYSERLRDVAEKARHVDETAAAGGRSAEFEAALADLRAALDRLASEA